MVEVLFTKSEAEIMKLAKNEGFIEGNPEDVICIESILDIGDIKEKINSEYRIKLIFDTYIKRCYSHSNKTLNELENLAKEYMYEEKRLMDYVLKGKQIRIWYSNAPYSICGCYYVCNLLRDTSNEVFTIKLPEYTVENNNVLIFSQSFGENSPERLRAFLKYSNKLDDIEKIVFGGKWLQLVKDNSPLRAVVNGQLIGVSEDFYDEFIYKKLENKSKKQIELIGELVGEYHLGMSDWWYAARIQYLIDKNKLKVVVDSEEEHKRVISCV